MAPRITVVGSANVDYIMQAPHLPSVGETVTDCTFMQTFGGKGANQAVAAARAGGAVHLIGATGTESVADEMRAGFVRDGINLDGLTRCEDAPSGSALVMFDDQGRNYLTVAPGANYRVNPEQVEAFRNIIASSDWVIMQMEIPVETLEAVLAVARADDVPVLLNYAPVREPGPTLDQAVHGLVVNEVEAGALAQATLGSDDIEDACNMAATLRHQGNHQFVALTLGANGVVVDSDEASVHVPGFAVDAVDTTAAGDTFCGALAVALAEGRSLAEAAAFSNAASALAVTAMGAQPSIPRREAIEKFLATHPNPL